MKENVIDLQLSPAKLFALCIEGRGIRLTWIAHNLDVSVSLISKILSEDCNLTEKMREKLNDLLETDY
jgi:plasmid maintenance system antidote protein VapI